MASVLLGATAMFCTNGAFGAPAWHLPVSQSKQVPPEARAGVLHAVSAVGLILVRNSGDATGLAPRPRGSAVILRKDGLVLTNLHVIVEDNSPRAYDEIFFNLPPDGVSAQMATRRYRLKTVLVNKDYDLALLRVSSDLDGRPLADPVNLPYVELGDSKAVQLLDEIIIIGFPEKGGGTVTVNTGVIEGKDLAGNWLKSDARLIHGNSGGAAVNTEGKLIGIPTKVVIDERLIGKEPGPAPDPKRAYSSVGVGFLRPAHLVATMLSQLQETAGAQNPSPVERPPADIGRAKSETIAVRGVVKSEGGSQPVAGARVGLIPQGAFDVTATNLLTWGGTNGDGQFELNRPVAPGRYTMKVRALGYEDFIRDVDIVEKGAPLTVELRPLKQ
jgi:S1-C subfamily serine protease